MKLTLQKKQKKKLLNQKQIPLILQKRN